LSRIGTVNGQKASGCHPWQMVSQLFRTRRGEWIRATELMGVGEVLAWRARFSGARKWFVRAGTNDWNGNVHASAHRPSRRRSSSRSGAGVSADQPSLF
jgi:hypothetical protein